MTDAFGFWLVFMGVVALWLISATDLPAIRSELKRIADAMEAANRRDGK